MTAQESVGVIAGILVGCSLIAAFVGFDPLGIFNIFDKRRLNEKTEELEEPIIIKAPKLLPTTCEKCGCEYQAQQKHIRVSYVLGDGANECMYPKGIRVTECPLCGERNPVIFLKNEESEGEGCKQ